MGVGFGVPFFVSGLYKFMGKLADRTFLVQGQNTDKCVYIYIYEIYIYTEILFLCKADPTHA